MEKKIIVKILTVIFFLFILVFIFLKFSEKKEENKIEISESENSSYNSNIIKKVNYISKDTKGNTYIIDAVEGEIDIDNSDIIYLTDVKATITLKNSNNIKITSNFGKYNINNYDTIFSKNVIIKYLDNKITGEYLDFSLDRNSMIISRNAVYSNYENVLKADVIEMNIKTKDTKIFRYNNNEKVNIKSIN
jgi:lipopolysaccharide export system protein LptA